MLLFILVILAKFEFYLSHFTFDLRYYLLFHLSFALLAKICVFI